MLSFVYVETDVVTHAHHCSYCLIRTLHHAITVPKHTSDCIPSPQRTLNHQKRYHLHPCVVVRVSDCIYIPLCGTIFRLESQRERANRTLSSSTQAAIELMIQSMMLTKIMENAGAYLGANINDSQRQNTMDCMQGFEAEESGQGWRYPG